MTKQDPKDVSPGASLPWRWDWSAWLPDGDTISAASVVVSDGLTNVGSAAAAAGIVTQSIAVDADAAEGRGLTARCTITTAAGLVDSRTVHMRVVAR